MALQEQLFDAQLTEDLASLEPQVIEQLKPYIFDAAKVMTHANKVLDQFGMTPQQAREEYAKAISINTIFQNDLTNRANLAAQYKSVELTVGTTLALKAHLINLGMPDETFVYRKG